MEILNKHIAGTPPDAVYIGRGSPMGNLKVIGKDGTRAEVIDWYKGWLFDRLIERDEKVEKAFRALNADSRLLCFCSPRPCHGEVIVKYWEEINTAPSYEEGLSALRSKLGKAIPEPLNDSKEQMERYKLWLIDKLISRDPTVTQDFKELSLTKELIPEEFRGIYKLSEEVLLPLHRKLMVPDEYDNVLLKLTRAYGKMPAYGPLTDGIDHINIYSKGRTILGRSLTNFAHCGFQHPDHGHFNSVEGFWYWLATGKQFDDLRTLSGFQAKEVGRKYPRIDIKNFKQEIKEALLCRLESDPRLKAQLAESDLPFTHYYYYGNPENCKVIAHDDALWLVNWWEKLRLFARKKAYRVIVAGSRGIDDLRIIRSAIEESGFVAVEFVSGTAIGADRLGEQVAAELEIPVRRFPAQWDKHGKAAGMFRNREMGDYADALIAVWDGVSPGTKSMIDYMLKLGKPVFIKTTKEQNFVSTSMLSSDPLPKEDTVTYTSLE